jgi:glycosyltransferase involved in cell wall biosynthesis
VRWLIRKTCTPWETRTWQAVGAKRIHEVSYRSVRAYGYHELLVRVLVLHSRYLSGSASGENRVVEDETRLLREGGHDVVAWTPSMPERPSVGQLAGAGLGAVWSRRAAAAVRDVLRRQGFDVVHVHNLYPSLSPAVIRAAVAQGVKVVVTLHNYRLLCLPATFLRQGRPCEDCLGRNPWPGVLHRCYRGSRAASASLATSLSTHRALGTFGDVSTYLAVSGFVRQKHIEAGFDPARITVRPNFAWPTPRRSGPGRHFLYLGRLSPEKGIPTLLRAWREFDAPLLVAGDGPDRSRLERLAPPRVTFVGPVAAGTAADLLRDARALILPAESFEAAPRSIPEAFAAGVPVIATRRGGIPESVDDGTSGILIPPGDVASLRKAVEALMDDRRSVELGESAHRSWSERFAPAEALSSLERIYSGG